MVYFQIDFKKRTTNPDDMEIKDKLVLNGMPWQQQKILNTRNTPGYYIVQQKSNAYTLQEQYTCYAFDPTVITPEGELVCPDKFMTPIRKTYYWYHDSDEAIPVMVNLKQVVMT